MFTQSHIHEECGVFGIYVPATAAGRGVAAAYYALYALQHRGQESCGIAVNDDGVIRCLPGRGPGAARSSRRERAGRRWARASMAVGHVRYGTTGSRQPRQRPAAGGQPHQGPHGPVPTTAT